LAKGAKTAPHEIELASCLMRRFVYDAGSLTSNPGDLDRLGLLESESRRQRNSIDAREGEHLRSA